LKKLFIPVIVSIFFLGLFPLNDAFAILIDFDPVFVSGGQIIDNEYVASNGVTISAMNFDTDHNGPDLAVIFDTHVLTGGDSDLVGPPTDPNGWDGGNLDLGDDAVDLEGILILEENDFDANNDGFVGDQAIDAPDDEAGNPAGKILIEFDDCIDSFGFDMVDVEPPAEVLMGSGYVAFWDAGFNNELARVQFEWFSDNTQPLFFDNTINFGDDHANRISPITAATLSILTGNSITGFNGIEFNLGGSGGFDNLNYEHCVVGGTGFEIDKTSLLVSGAQSNAVWMIPVIVAGIGFAIVIARKF